MSNHSFENRQLQTPARGPQKSKSNFGKWVLGIGGVGLLMFMLCCGGVLWLAMYGMGVVAQDLRNELRDSPEVRQHIGEISSFETNYTKSMAAEGDNTFVYDVDGTKSSAEMTIESESLSDGSESIISASMRLPDGEVIEISLDGL